MNHLLFRSLSPDGSVRCRCFTEAELKADPEFAAGWETNDTQELDRPIMLRNRTLWWWARPYMPKEISEECDELVMQNMLKDAVTTVRDEYDDMHKGSGSRFILVISRAKGIRLKLPLQVIKTLAPGQKFTRLLFDPKMLAHIKTVIDSLRLEP